MFEGGLGYCQVSSKEWVEGPIMYEGVGGKGQSSLVCKGVGWRAQQC